MRKKIDYSIKVWEKEKKYIFENYNLLEVQQKKEIDSDILELYQRNDSCYIESYDFLSDSYSEYGELKYIGENSILEYKKNLYLSAKAMEICYLLLNKGEDEIEEISEGMLSGESSNYAAIEAIIAGDNELALRLVGENSFIGSLLLGKYEEALKYPLNYQERAHIKQAFISVAEGDEKGLEENVIARIKQMRREAKIEVTMVDIFSLGILKLAKMRGMNCNIHVVEIPEEVLEDTPIDFDKLHPPVPECVKKILEN